MRPLRLLLAAAVLSFVALVGFSSSAFAQEEGDGEETPAEELEHANEECIEILEAGGDVETCQEAPNQLLPERNEIIWGALGFLVVFIFVWRFGLPSIKDGMNKRAERIQAELDTAETQRAEADTILSDYKAQLADARNESARIIEEARQQADSLKKDQEQRLQAELTEMRQRATAEIEAAKTTAIADLRGEVAQLAVGAAEVVVKHNLDQASQLQLIEDYINQVAGQQRS